MTSLPRPRTILTALRVFHRWDVPVIRNDLFDDARAENRRTRS